jgi:hypothetical protein
MAAQSPNGSYVEHIKTKASLLFLSKGTNADQVPVPDPDPGFDNKKFINFTAENNPVFCGQKLHFIYPYASTKDVQTARAFKREHPTQQNMKILHF